MANARPLTLIAIAASLAGLLFGFDTAVISGVTGQLRQIYHLTPESLGLVVSSALWGTLAGAIFSGRPGDRFGARFMLRIVAVLYLVSAVGGALAWDIQALVLFRFLGGLGIGASSVLAPVYIAEIAPKARRGALVGLFQTNIVIGILAAYLTNFLIGGLASGDQVWRLKLLSGAVPALVFLLLMFRIPNSPRWLKARGRSAEANAISTALSLEDWSAADNTPKLSEKLSWSLDRRPILLAVTLALFNQFSGINAILYYLNDIFRSAGFSSVSADLQAVVIGAANLLATLAGVALIDRLGRKLLLMVGGVGTAIALLGVALIMSAGVAKVWLLPCLVLFIVSFAFSQGAVIWVYLSEIFPARVRAQGQGVGSAAHWLANAAIAAIFPLVAASSKGAPFFVFAACMGVQVFVIATFFPETRGVSLEAMESHMVPSKADP